MDRGELLALLEGLRQWPPQRVRPVLTDLQVGLVMIVVAVLGGFAIGFGAHSAADRLFHHDSVDCHPQGVALCEPLTTCRPSPGGPSLAASPAKEAACPTPASSR